MQVLVCGVTGFIGSAIALHLLNTGHRVRGLSRSVEHAARFFASHEDGQRALAEDRLSFMQGDVTAPSSLSRVVEDVEAVIQAAQFERAPIENPARGLTYESIDLGGTVNLLHAIAEVYGAYTPAVAGTALQRSATSPHFLYVSGITVAAEAPEPWNRAKWQAEEAIRESGFNWTIVRCCWAYGPGDKALNRLIGYSDFLPFVPLFGRGDQLLTPVFVEDIGSLFARLVSEPGKSRDTLFRLGGPDVVTLDGFVKVALAAMGRRRPLLHIPKRLARSQARLLQHLPGKPLTPDAVDFVTQDGAAEAQDRELIADRFPGFIPTPLSEGLRAYLGRD